MKTRVSLFAGLLVSGAAAVAIAAAPSAMANPLAPECEGTGGGGFEGGASTECVDPGNAQIVSTPPVYAYPWEGGFGYGGYFM